MVNGPNARLRASVPRPFRPRRFDLAKGNRRFDACVGSAMTQIAKEVLTPPTPPQPPSPPSGLALPDGSTIPITGVPGSPNELRGLRERRDVLRDQLERAVSRRSSLVEQLNPEEGRPLAPEARVGIQQRLQALDERIMQIERDQAVTEQQISNAPAEVLAMESSERYAGNNRVDEGEAAGMAFGAFTVGIMLTLFAGRIRRWRARRRGKNTGMNTLTPLPSDDPRIERLTQTVDAMAEELERIGEGQRFVTQLLSKRQDAVPAAVPAAAPAAAPAYRAETG